MKNKYTLVKAGAIFTSVAVVGSMFAGCSKEQIDLSSVTDDQLVTLTFDELMEILQDGLKKENVMTVYNFLDNFNGNLADSLYLEGDGEKRFQIPWDTAIAMVLAYNEFDATEMYEMFDSYDLRANDLYRTIKGYTTMAIPAYIRLTSNTKIADLIQKQEDKEFYLKYENKLIEMNKARFKALESGSENDKNTFDAIAKSFHDMIRDDFLNDSGETSFGSLSEGYTSGKQGSVVPIISAAMDITRNTPGRFTDDEVEELNLDGYCNTIETIITENIKKLETAQTLAGMNMATGPTEKTTAESKEKEEITTIDIKYEIIREAAIKQLQKDDKYFISNELSTLPIHDFTGDMASRLSTQAQAYATTQVQRSKEEKTTSKEYSNKEDLEKDYPDLVDKAKKQEDEINKNYENENQKASSKAQQEANSKASQKSEENNKKADQEIKNKNTTAKVEDNKGNTHDYEIKDPNSGNIVIDDSHTTTDKSGNSGLDFDGPIYDENGNEIAVKKYGSTAGYIKVLQIDVERLFGPINKLTNTIGKLLSKRL